MNMKSRDDALSEVIGFILIIAILVVIASLYMTYVVPAQGREAEIEHMNYVEKEFVDFKMAVDSLWINQEIGTQISQSIELGTLGQKTEGQFVFLPLTNPVASDGKIELINDDSAGTIEVTVKGKFLKEEYNDLINQDIDIKQYINSLNTSNLFTTQIENMVPFTPAEGNTTTISGENWTAKIRSISMPLNKYNVVMDLDRVNKTGYTYSVFNNMTIKEKIDSPTWINLQDPAYGLDISGPVTISDGNKRYNGSYNIFNNKNPVTNALSDELFEDDSVTTIKRSLGKLNYTGINNYWVNQEYNYQMGGVTLKDLTTGEERFKILPLISLGVDDKDRPTMSLTVLRITGVKGNVGGSTPVQILTEVTDIRSGVLTDTNDQRYLESSENNAVSVKIKFSNLNEKMKSMWNNAFSTIRTSANKSGKFDQSWVNMPASTSDELTFDYNPDGLTLDYKEVDVTVNLQPVGWN